MRIIPFTYLKKHEPVLTVQLLTLTGGPRVYTVPNLYFDSDNIIVECWGGGGKGGRANVAEFVSFGKARGGGGGGGAYSKSTFTLYGGQSIDYQIGDYIYDDTDTWFNSPSIILAKGGSNGIDTSFSNGGIGAGGAGGSSLASIGTLKYSGGNGVSGGNTTNYSGGGGGAAGSGGNGFSASQQNGGSGGTGGNPSGGVGKGGDGRIGTTNSGFAGTGYGAGGGGGLTSANTSSSPGGAGISGVIRLTYYI